MTLADMISAAADIASALAVGAGAGILIALGKSTNMDFTRAQATYAIAFFLCAIAIQQVWT